MTFCGILSSWVKWPIPGEVHMAVRGRGHLTQDCQIQAPAKLSHVKKTTPEQVFKCLVSWDIFLGIRAAILCTLTWE